MMDSEDLTKPQNVRLADIFVLGPFSIWFGAKANEMPGWARAALIAYGAGTILYNGNNYLEIEAKEKKKLPPAEESE